MDKTLLTAGLAGLGGMFGWGFADFFAKKTIDEIGDVTSLVLAHLFGTAGFLLIVLAHAVSKHAPVSLPPTVGGWTGVAFFGALQAAVYLLVYRGFGKGQLALLNPLFASFSGLAAVLSLVLFGEVVSGHLVLALVTLFIGVVLLNLDPSQLREWRVGFASIAGFPEIASATILAAVWTVLWGHFIRGHDAVAYAALMYLFMTVVLIGYALVTRISLRVARPVIWLYLVLIGLCETGAYLAVSWGYAGTNHLSVVALVSGAFSLPTILLARVFLKERTTRLQAVASAVIIGAIVLLNA